MNVPFRYHLGEEALEVRLFGWTVRRVRYDDMVEVRPGYPFWNEHWNNFWPWRFLTVRRKTGLCKNFVINPGDRETFAAQLKGKAALR